MQIVDAQIHVWGSGLPSNLAHRQVTAFTTEEAVGMMDAGGVDAAVIHPPGWDPGATVMAFAAVRDYPGRFAIMGALPLDQPESRALVATWRSQPGMLGLRYTFLREPLRGWLEDGTLDWLWAAAERAGVPIALLATDSLPAIGRIAERDTNVAVMAINRNDAITFRHVTRNGRLHFIRQTHISQSHNFRVEVSRFGLSNGGGRDDFPSDEQIDYPFPTRFCVRLH